MPTSKPRVLVTLEESQYQVIENLSALRGVSKASILRDLVDASEDTLRRVAQVLMAARRAESEYKGVIKRDLEEADNKIRPLMEQVIELFSEASDNLEKKLQ